MDAWRRERGAVTIIEAAFVFPIVFFVVFFLIMAGETYYQSARVEYAVTSAAISGAARCENPMLGEVIRAGSVPKDPAGVDVLPYRYIFTGESRKVAQEIEQDLRQRIASLKPLLFRGMSPQNVWVEADPHINILVSSLSVRCSFDVPFPIRMIFSGKTMKTSHTVQMTAPVGDPSEFVRNVAMIKDIMERSETATRVMEKLGEIAGKVGDFIN